MDKFENFHGCTLYFEFVPIFPTFAPIAYNQKGKVSQCSGFLCHASNSISDNLNFRIKMKVSMDKPCQFKLNFCWFAMPSVAVQTENFFMTQPFMSFDDRIAVPPSGPYNGFEKLLMPFDETTWRCLASTFTFLFGAITAMRFSRPQIRDVVLGRKTTTPALNVLRAFFGISQIQTPISGKDVRVSQQGNV